MDWEEGIKDIYQLPDSDLKTGARYNRTMSFHDAGPSPTTTARRRMKMRIAEKQQAAGGGV
eukprot:CAMPEP_0194696924 /NCGR_PEP_ID=MMETSP0295-20121207/23047_1 /TAXON_ID=39354 /ORGANISM="Heterosigma akashiwo, Strain CCMP2393" /LENGTH=60 /DNA_ID=CAMNT_0039589351 /DNA_START=428 /DNA_END=610 /DNA_ORIENTATION=-